jgi:membrane-associated protease RseP (regulator of RpoE activity)
MRFLLPVFAIVILITVYAGAATTPVALVRIDSKDFGDTNSLIQIEELERDAKTSKLRMTHQKMGSSVGSSMFIMRGFYEVAKSRGAEYFINLKEWDDKEGGRIYIAGFTNTKDADLKQEFGAEYDYSNEYGQKRGYMSVSQCKGIFETPPGSPIIGNNNLSGIGAVVNKKNGACVITKLLEQSGAVTAGLKEGDIITHIDTKDISALNLFQITMLLRGEPETKVVITIQRAGEADLKNYPVVRPSVKQ